MMLVLYSCGLFWSLSCLSPEEVSRVHICFGDGLINGDEIKRMRRTVKIIDKLGRQMNNCFQPIPFLEYE